VAPTNELVEAVRAELAAIDPPRRCCRAAERAGLGDAARGRARSPAVARLAVRLADEDADPGTSPTDLEWRAARGHCRAAWLRGRFLAVGSLSLGAHGPHLELVVPPAEADELARRLEEVGFPAPLRPRRGRAVATWKRTDTIIAFLRSCGASASVLELESRLVMRQLQGHLNRVLNAETANLTRSVASSARHIAIIDLLEAEGRLAEMPDVDRVVAAERRAAPEASFTELSERLGMSRARVQRAFQHLEAAASHVAMAGSTTTPAGDL
jgi:DNA-binding protein WhiA